jgi:MarR family transcriptional regulator, 2-MHQ and catechol-resistance regulon repressor
MAIEQEIKQSRFKSENQRAMINLLFTYGWTLERIKQVVAEEGITHQQYNILRILRGSLPSPLSTLQIRARMLDKMSDTSRIVDRLIVKGLVKKGTCRTDRRLVDVTITEKGKKLLEKLDARQNEMEEIFGNLTRDEARTLNSLLDKIREEN